MSGFDAVRAAAIVVASWISACVAPRTPTQDPPAPGPESLSPYKPTEEVAGHLSSMGSDTMNSMMTLWMESFRKFHPKVSVEIEGKGNSMVPPALIEGTAQIGPMSREPKAAEQDRFEKKFGYKATILSVALEALAVYVNKDNPLDEITLEQVDAVFSKHRNRGYPEDIRTWGQLGLKGEWADRLISHYGRNSASGTYGLFKEVVLKQGDYKDTAKELPGSASVCTGVADDRYGIGYSGIGYGTPWVKKLRIADKAGSRVIAADAENVINGTYPLRRFLFIVINKPPDRPLPPLVREFCRYALSREGQRVVEEDGFIPVTAATAKEQLKKLGIEK